MKIQQVIEKAIEGGYITPKSKFNGVQTDVVLQEVVFLDPLFWKCLGTSLNWQGMHSDIHGQFPIPIWHYWWIRFIDHLASGQNAESFFEQF